MKKELVTIAMTTALLIPSMAHADWATGSPITLGAKNGEAAMTTALTSQQSLSVNLSTKEGPLTDVYFSMYEKESVFALENLPTTTAEDDREAMVTVTPLVHTDGGYRFYLVETGAPSGTYIVSYKKGDYQTAFSANQPSFQSFTTARFNVTKKTLRLILTNKNHELTYDKKTNTFTLI